MSDFRTEKDSLGEMRVPKDALYGAQTQRAVQNFPISGLRPWRAFVWSMATIKRAAAEVNNGLGLLDDERAKAIVEAAQEVIDGKWDAQFVVDPFQAGAGTSHNMNTNEVIANRANQILGYSIEDPKKPVNPNDHVNMAQSTNDTIPTPIRLGALWLEDELLKDSPLGRQILKLRAEKDALLDTVWLATSSAQVRDLWSRVSAVLGEEVTPLQQQILLREEQEVAKA